LKKSEKNMASAIPKLPSMSNERIAELNKFKTRDFADCPVQTPEQLQEFKPKYPDALRHQKYKSFSIPIK